MFAIGMLSPDFVGRGYGAESARLVLRHAFTTLALHRLLAARAVGQRAGDPLL